MRHGGLEILDVLIRIQRVKTPIIVETTEYLEGIGYRTV